MKKLLTLLLGLIFMFFAVGCTANDNSSLNNSTGGNTSIVKTTEDCYQREFYADMAKYNIIDKGVAKYCILLPKNASEILEFAAEDLNWFLYCSTGVSLPVIHDGDTLPAGIKNYISIGKTQAFANLNIDPKYDELSTDGFRVYVRDKNFYSISNVDRGALYGCYDMLERYITLRFLNRDATYYITGDTVWFADYDFTCVPEFAQRTFLSWNRFTWAYGPRTTQYGEFVEDVYGTPWAVELGNIHTIRQFYVKPSEWKDTHPEFFSSYTNPRVKEEDVCWSNGITDDGKLDESMDISVAKVVINTIIEYLKKNPEREFFMLGISDQHDAYCMCDVCEDREAMLGEKSGITTMFVNVVAEEVNKWVQSEEGQEYGVNHDVNIVQFAYYWTLTPPVHKENGEWVLNHPLAKPNKYIYVRYTPINANMAFSLGHDKQMLAYKEIVEGWSSICDKLMIYDYCTQLGLITSYLPHISKLGEQAKYLKENNFYYWMFESEWTTDGVWCVDLVGYILERLWWNVDADVQAIIEEYVTLNHGKAAAPYVMRFVTRMEDNLAVLREGDLLNTVFGTQDISVDNYPRALLEQAIFDLSEAQKAIDNCPDYTDAEKETYTKRLNEVKVIPESMMLFNYHLYYLNDEAGKIKLVTDYYHHANSIGLQKFHRKLENNKDGMTVQEFYDSIVNN